SAIVDGRISGYDCQGVANGQACVGVDPDEELEWVCVDGACQASSCGDGFIDARRDEECDENTAGCTNDCLWVCTGNEDCDDLEFCNGTETCNIASHTCASGTLPANGVACTTANDEPGTCQSLVCTPAVM